MRIISGMLLAAWAASALAQAPAAVQMKSMGRASFVCGGIAEDGREMLRPLESKSSARLMFITQKRHGYVADVAFKVNDARSKETLIDALADGPICLLQLPPGRYRVEARLAGVLRTASLDIGRVGRAQAVFTFPEDPGERISASPEEKWQGRTPN